MSVRIVSGTSNQPLAAAVAAALRCELARCDVERFPDGEIRPVVSDVRGDDVYVVQSTGRAVNDHFVEMFMLLDACRRVGAERITAVVPYFGYARQDRRSRVGQAIGLRVMVDALASARPDRLIVIDPHTAALEAVCTFPVEMLTAVRSDPLDDLLMRT